MPEANASDWSAELLRPVSAMMKAGLQQSRSFSRDRMARVASNPSMTGMDISTVKVSIRNYVLESCGQRSLPMKIMS